jgi:hypothetical protein
MTKVHTDHRIRDNKGISTGATASEIAQAVGEAVQKWFNV